MKPVHKLPPLLQAVLAAAREPVAKDVLVEEITEGEGEGRPGAVRGAICTLVVSGRLLERDDGKLVTAVPESAPSTLHRCACGMPVVAEGDQCADCAAKLRRNARSASARRRNARRAGPRRRMGVAPAVHGDRPRNPLCPNPLKIAHPTEREALVFLAAERWYDQWPYRCACNAWHNATQRWTDGWRVRVLDALALDPEAPIDRATYRDTA